MEPEMTPTPASTSVLEIGYAADAEEVWVRFTSGRLYVYSHVPRVVWEEMVASPSVGGFVNAVLKPGYPYRHG